MTPRSLPEALEISVAADGMFLADAWVMITLNVTRKNPHGMLAGPTGANGRLTVPRAEIEANVRRTVVATPMDFAGLDAWDGSISVEADNRERVREVLAAVATWEDLGNLKTEDDLMLLREYGRSLEALAAAELLVEVSCEPPGAAEVETLTVKA